MDVIDLATKLSGAGLATTLIVILITGWKGVWIFSSQLTRERFLLEQQRDQLLRERDAWQRLALGATVTADKAVEHAAILQQKGVA